MGYRLRATITEDGTLITPGVEMGPVMVHKRSGDWLVVYKAPHRYWGGLGRPQSYSPAAFKVFKILSEVEEGHLELEEILDFPARVVRENK